MKKKGITISAIIIVLLLLLTACDNISQKDNTVSLYDRTTEFLEQEFHRVYDPYYDIQNLTISNWEENGNEATFFYKMTFLYYNRDPDAAEYIQKAKESDPDKYKVLYDDYLKEKEANYEFKIVFTEDNIELFSNVSPKGIEWQPVEIGDYIMK